MAAKPPARTVRVVDIVGNAEVRRLAGRMIRANRKTSRGPVSRHVLLRWRKSHGFPEPIKKLDASEIWDRREVRAWLERYIAESD